MTDPRRLLDDASEASPALRTLLASARRGDDPRGPQIEALSARIAASIAPLAAGPFAPAPLAPLAPSAPVVASAAASVGHAALAAKVGAVIAALGALCGGAWYVRSRGDDARSATATRRTLAIDAGHAVASDAPEPAVIEAVVPPPTAAPSPGSASAPPRPEVAPRQPRGAGHSENEAKLVIAAGAALVRGDAAAALALTRSHLAQFPTGAHGEERDRIAIEALTRLGRLDDAHAAADRFFLRYPRSIYRPRIEGLVK